MPRSNETLLRVAGISVPMILIAVAAHSALKPPKNAPVVSASIPSPEELDSLSRYLKSQPSRGLPRLVGNTQLPGDEIDPFVSVEYAVAAAATTTDSTASVPSLPTLKPIVRDRYVVSAILISGERRIAVINESLVTVGSMLPGGFRVTAIENDHVQIVAPSGATRMLAIRESTGP